ncbi:MAG: hypothetical protein GX051_08225 [Clostridiales bacterium]|nr:hypothetical protein [Clostridiales bacterium]
MEKHTRRTIITTVVICLFLFGGALVATNYEKWFGASPVGPSGRIGSGESTGTTLPIDPDAGEYVTTQSAQESNGGISIPGWAKISIPAGEKDISVDFPNPEKNAGKYYLSFELRLKDSGEVLYKSGLVPPGQTIQKISLSRTLNEGTYKAVIHVQPYKMDENRTSTNNADMETDLVVYRK